MPFVNFGLHLPKALGHIWTSNSSLQAPINHLLARFYSLLTFSKSTHLVGSINFLFNNNNTTTMATLSIQCNYTSLPCGMDEWRRSHFPFGSSLSHSTRPFFLSLILTLFLSFFFLCSSQLLRLEWRWRGAAIVSCFKIAFDVANLQLGPW